MDIKFFTKDLKSLRFTPDIEETCEKKIRQGFKKYASKKENGQKLFVIVKIADYKSDVKVDLELDYLNYKIKVGVSSKDGILTLLDKSIDIAGRQIEKYKTRIYKSIKKNPKFIATSIADNDVDDVDVDVDIDKDIESNPKEVIKVENYAPKPMNVEEAVLQLELLDWQFLYFYNTEINKTSVIYKRTDGNFGLIEDTSV